MNLMEFLNTRVVPSTLILVMFGLGLSLTLADFKRVIVFPKAAAIGLVGQLVGMPAAAFLLAYLLAPNPSIAVGLVILGACPSGTTSNAYSFAARADVALCVTLSAVTSIITVFTIPLLTYVALQAFFEQGQIPDLPVANMLWTLTTVTLIPVTLGMIVRRIAPGLTERALEPIRKLTLVLLILVLTAAAASSWQVLRDNFAIAGLLVVTMNLSTMAMGYYLAKLGGLAAPQRVTVTYEVGIQNLALAMLITLTLLKRPDLAIAALLYAVVMPASALAFLPFARRIIEKEEQAAHAAAERAAR